MLLSQAPPRCRQRRAGARKERSGHDELAGQQGVWEELSKSVQVLCPTTAPESLIGSPVLPAHPPGTVHHPLVRPRNL